MDSIEYVPLIKQKYNGDDYKKLNIPKDYKENIDIILNCCSELKFFDKIYKILLFGSCAKQTIHKGSDIDILVITNEKLTRDEILEMRFLIDMKVPNMETDIVFYTDDSFMSSEMPLIKAIKKKNYILYQRK